MTIENVGLRCGDYKAGTDFSKTGTLTSYGWSGTGQYLAVAQSTTADLTIVLAAANTRAAGIIQNDAAVGYMTEVCREGATKAVAGGAVTRGDLLEVGPNGQLITSTAAGHLAMAEARESATGIGTIFSVWWFPVPYLHP